MLNILPYVPFLNYKQMWLNKKLNQIKLKRNNIMLKDIEGNEIDWSVVEYMLSIYYNMKYFNSDEDCDGMRLHPEELEQYM